MNDRVSTLTSFYNYKDYLAAKGPEYSRIRKAIINGGSTCPNIDGSKGTGGCIFCNNYAFSPAADKESIPVITQLENNIKFLKKRYGARRFIAFFQSNSNTYGNISHLEQMFQSVIDHDLVSGLAISTRPDCVNKPVIDMLDRLGKKKWVTLEIGVQTCLDETLKLVNRCHSFSDTSAALDLSQNRSFELCLHLILGLPGENHSQWIKTARTLNKWHYHTLKITQAYVVKQTVLADWYKDGRYTPLTQDQYVQGIVDFLQYVPSHVGIQRFQGSAPRNLYLAPDWARDSLCVKEAILKEFKKRGTWQGIHYSCDAT